MYYKDKVCWITGASSGIGRALAELLVEEGALLILTGRDESSLRVLQAEYPEANIQLLVADVASGSPEELAQHAIHLYGVVDYFFPAAGISQRALSAHTSASVLRYLMELNFFVPIFQSEALLQLQQSKPLHIVAFSSMAGLMGFPLRSAYAAAKHALKGYFETWQTEHQDTIHHCTIVYPGRINTAISENALLGDGASHGIKDMGQAKGITAQRCADLILTAVRRRKSSIIIAKSERLLYWLWWFMPKTYRNLAAKHGLEKK